MTHPSEAHTLPFRGLWCLAVPVMLSRARCPKLLCLTGAEGLFKQAAKPMMGLCANNIQMASPIAVSGQDHRFMATERLREICICPAVVLLEPVAKKNLVVPRQSASRV